MPLKIAISIVTIAIVLTFDLILPFDLALVFFLDVVLFKIIPQIDMNNMVLLFRCLKEERKEEGALSSIFQVYIDLSNFLI